MSVRQLWFEYNLCRCLAYFVKFPLPDGSQQELENFLLFLLIFQLNIEGAFSGEVR